MSFELEGSIICPSPLSDVTSGYQKQQSKYLRKSMASSGCPREMGVLQRTGMPEIDNLVVTVLPRLWNKRRGRERCTDCSFGGQEQGAV